MFLCRELVESLPCSHLKLLKTKKWVEKLLFFIYLGIHTQLNRKLEFSKVIESIITPVDKLKPDCL